MTSRPKEKTMSTQRRAALLTGVIAALALAAPVAGASADTPSASAAGVANGPTLIGDTFNGGTALVTSPSPASGTVVGAP
jgi:hypothetical protein